MQRACDSCGEPYEAKTKRSRFCARGECKRERERLQKRSQRGGSVVPFARPASDSGLVDAVVAELEEAGRLDSYLGQVAVEAARRVMSAEKDTGSSVAALLRELRASMEAALATAQRQNPVDELRRKRMERLGQGA